jgi:hypothetical protein
VFRVGGQSDKRTVSRLGLDADQSGSWRVSVELIVLLLLIVMAVDMSIDVSSISGLQPLPLRVATVAW